MGPENHYPKSGHGTKYEQPGQGIIVVFTTKNVAEKSNSEIE